jgi:hypothetical protein
VWRWAFLECLIGMKILTKTSASGDPPAIPTRALLPQRALQMPFNLCQKILKWEVFTSDFCSAWGYDRYRILKCGKHACGVLTYVKEF